PFRIPTTAGQQKSLSWIPQSKLDNPSTKMQVVGRMILEVLVFRSLFRNTKFEMQKGAKFYYQWEKWLWLAGLAFHYAFLVILIRHLRFFTEPVPFFVHDIERVDGILGWASRHLHQRHRFYGGGDLPVDQKADHPAVALHIASAGFLSTFSAPCNRNDGHSYPLFHQGGPD